MPDPTSPLATAPFVTPVQAIEPGWIDYNGHLNMAYYNVLFDRAADAFVVHAGLGPDYVTTRGGSYMTVEIHVCYVRELMLTDLVVVHARVLDVDDKRLQLYCELRHATEGWLSATSEQMYLHVDMATRKTAPWPADIRAALDRMKAAADTLPRPERAGRAVGIARKR